jgi:hypothetical protein
VLGFLGKAARAEYQNAANSLNCDLTKYLKTTKYIGEDDRLEICKRPPSFYKRPGAFWFIRVLIPLGLATISRASLDRGANSGDGEQWQPGEQHLSSLELMNAYQAWEAVFDRFLWAIACLVIFPLWIVCATAASALVGDSPPFDLKLVYLCILSVFVAKVFAAYLRINKRESVLNRERDNLRRLFGMLLGLSDKRPFGATENPDAPSEPSVPPGELPLPPSKLLTLLSRPLKPIRWLLWPLSLLLDLSAVAVSGWLLYGAWLKLSPLEVSGALLLSMLGTFIVAVAAICLVLIAESNTGRVRMAAVAVYLAGAAALVFAARLSRPGWPSWLVHGTQSAVWASLILVGVLAAISLLCFLARVSLWHWKNRRHVIEELIQTLTWLGQRLEDPEITDRNDVGLFEDLEYTAGLIENYLPRKLRPQDLAGDSNVAEQCRDMAAAFRHLKLEVSLNQSMTRPEIASRIVPTIGPIFYGDWKKMPYIVSQGPAASRLKHTARGLSHIVIALVPLAALLVLHDLKIVPSPEFAQALPIVVTWLIVSILTWIDPRAESSITNTSNVMSALAVSKVSRSGRT